MLETFQAVEKFSLYIVHEIDRKALELGNPRVYIVHEIDRKALELGNPREVGVRVSFSQYMGK